MDVLKFPLAKITICFMLGIYLSQLAKPTFIFAVTFQIVCLLSLAILFFTAKKHATINTYFGLLVLITSFSIGISTSVFHNQTLHPNHYSHQIDSTEDDFAIELLLKERLKSTYNNDRYVSEIKSLNKKESYGKIILNINRDSIKNDLQIGSNLLVSGKIYLNRKPNNPNQFDYGKYLENQQIYAQIYTDIEKTSIGSTPEKSLNYYAAKLRNTIIKNLEANHFNPRELHVVIALILGQQQDISQDIIRDYQFAGAVHILSVSGLHVGFILLFISILLKPIPNTKSGLIIKLLITLLGLWMFGILAGLAPSVVRSVTMFSFVAIGIYLRRSVNIYHTLLVSILLILALQPSFLFDIGFQLSYVALFFIVWFQPLLASMWNPKNKIKKYFWDIITVSFAAQIGTFPLSIYYFHQFPGLFFITNLVILPLLSIIMAIALFVVVLAAFNYVPYYPMKALEWSIVILNKIINWVASFESFIFTNIPLNSYMMWSCYLIIITLIIWAKKPSVSKLYISLMAIILFQTCLLFAKSYSQKEEEFIVFNRKGYSLITERHGKNVNAYSNDSIIKNINDNLVLKSYLVANFCKTNKLEITKNFYYFKNKKILLIDSSGVYNKNIQPDILILSNSPKINLERLFENWKPKEVVVDASNFKTYVKAWKATCRKEKIPFHDTTEKGFFKL